MTTDLSYKTFGREKSINEILYKINCWNADLRFKRAELKFILKLIDNYPFNTNTRNLFERIQLFTKDLKNLENELHNLSINIDSYTKYLIGQEEEPHPDQKNYYLVKYHSMAEAIFNYNKTYDKIKQNVYEYVSGIMEPNLNSKKQLT